MPKEDRDYDDETAPGLVKKQEREAEKKTASDWAHERGLLPQYMAGGGAVPFAASRVNPEYWKWAAAKALRGWDETTQITSAELDAAITEATSGQLIR